MAKIFVSYRRADSAYVTATLCEKLQQRFGRESVFYDIDTVPLGVDFRNYITNAVEQCNVLLAMIGDTWNDPVQAGGPRRLDDPSNYVRIEIEAALRRSIPVVPVLVGEAQMPELESLPASIQEIVFRNATEIRAGRDFQQHIKHIIDGLDGLFGDEGPRSGPPPLPIHRPGASTPPPLRRAQEDPAVSALRSLLRDCTDPHVYLGGLIPPPKLHAARLSYAPNVAPEEVLLLYDNTLFGGAKDGALLTRDAVYWRNITDYQRLHARRFVDIRFVRAQSSFATSEVVVDAETIQVQIGATAMIADALARAIRSLAPQAA